jgi:hypothetical protein
MMAQFGITRVYGSGLAIVRTLLEQPQANAEKNLRARVAEEESELALLAQFMRHDSVASLANAIAKRTGARSWDLIAAAGLDPSRTPRQPDNASGLTQVQHFAATTEA